VQALVLGAELPVLLLDVDQPHVATPQAADPVDHPGDHPLHRRGHREHDPVEARQPPRVLRAAMEDENGSASRRATST